MPCFPNDLRNASRRGATPKTPLTPAFVRNVSQSGRYCDGQGLFLDVRPSGGRSWIQRLTVRGRRTELGLGGFPLVSLKEAAPSRPSPTASWPGRAAIPWPRNAAPGRCPPLPMPLNRVWNQLRPAWRNRKHPKAWLSSLERYAFPRIGKRPVSEVSSADVLEILSPFWHVKAPMARCVRRRIRTVMEWAVAMELRPDNPCDRIGPVLGPQRDLVQHMPALPHREVASAIETVRASSARPVVKLAFEFLVLTAARSGEVRGAVWTEMDRDEGVWTLPTARMKTRREHRVPLSRRPLEILDTVRRLGDGGPFVFPSVQPGKQLGDMMLSGLLKDLKIAAVPHGFRSSFRDWAAGRDQSSPGGDRGGASSCGPEPGRGSLCPLGPVRAAAPAYG